MATGDDPLAQWATSFLAMQAQDAPHLPHAQIDPILPASITDETLAAITNSARDLLRAVDAGGVPAFMTSALKQIALDNHIELTEQSTPNEVIDALRARCTTSATTPTTNFD